ncbi:phosphate-import permease protein PhnE [Nocardioides luteus]|uniref:Phosphate-import permease protein PhnE n=1 Tax=Nocardioides luteus TaxID=1844 RepID=A0ABQ5T0X4_9ACTN|nr:phosphate-import permease protein PhnE [Nocardioides luteus]GLJ69894.1 phosphate-import permease protein PhnE [Nocardioides luteus]
MRPAPVTSEAREPRPPRAAVATWLIPLGYVAVALFGTWWIAIDLAALRDGASDISRLLARMVPVTFGLVPALLGLVLETLWIALAGTGIAALVSLPLAAAASRDFTGPKPVQWLARGLIVVTRAVPSLVFAIVFVRIFGLGPFAGALAIAFHSVGMIAKMMTDVFEELTPAPRESIDAVGSSRLQSFVATTLSRAMPSVSSLVLYRLDINIRASAVLGLVGAGGIGVALQTAIGSLNYHLAAGIIVVIAVLLLALELISFLSQRAVAEHAHDGTVAELYRRTPDPTRPGWNRGRALRTGSAVVFAGALLFALTQVRFDPGRLSRSWQSTLDLLAGFVPPVIDPAVVTGIFESLVMALTATTVGVVAGLVIAVLSSPHLIRFAPLSALLRILVVLIRSVPDVIYALVFVAALGLGPFAGFLALSISCTALAAKFFTDSLENVDPAPLRALEATGASRLQVFVSGVWPRFVPSLIGNSLFTSDLALRESAVLGIVGAGGVGFVLQESVATLDYGTTAGVLICLVVVVVALEAVARWARKKVI